MFDGTFVSEDRIVCSGSPHYKTPLRNCGWLQSVANHSRTLPHFSKQLSSLHNLAFKLSGNSQQNPTLWAPKSGYPSTTEFTAQPKTNNATKQFSREVALGIISTSDSFARVALNFWNSSRRYGSPRQNTNINTMSEAKVSKGALPNGYAFVPKGNIYITSNCRKLTQERGRSVFTVIDAKKQQIGIGVPTDIYLGVQFKERETRADRAANVLKRDESIAKGFEKEIMKEFPHIPSDSLRKTLKIALEKGKGKVGRTGKLDVRRKVHLAVRAHIRHCETDYDTLLRNGVAREDARKLVEAKIQDVFKAWRGGLQTVRAKPANIPKSPVRPSTKVIQTTKRVQQEDTGEATTKTRAPSLTAADSVDFILRTAQTASLALNNTIFTARHAMRASRQNGVVKKVVATKTTLTRQQKPASNTPKPEVVPTAASFRERRAPKPRVIQQVACSPPRKQARRTTQNSRNTTSLDRLGHRNRARIARWVATIDRIEHVLLTRCRRRSTKQRIIRNLYDQINKVLAAAAVGRIEPTAAARKDLAIRLST